MSELKSSQEQQILDRLAEVITKLSSENKAWLQGFGEGLAMVVPESKERDD